MSRRLKLWEGFTEAPDVLGLSDAGFALYVKLLVGSRAGKVSRRPEGYAPRVYRELALAGLLADDGTLGGRGYLFKGPFGEEGQRKHIPLAVRRAVYERDGFACINCGAFDDISLDHIVPYSLNGPDTVENLQTMCRPCNSRKGAKHG